MAELPTAEPRISSSVLRGLRLPLTEQNLDFDELLSECKLSADDVQRSHGKVPMRGYLRFMERAAHKANDPLLGIKLARSTGPESLGAVGFLFLSSRTLTEAISDFCSYLNVLQDTTDFQFTHDRKYIAFHYQLFGVPELDSRQDVEFSLALTSRLIRMFGGPEVDVEAVSFRHSPSVPVGEYERLLKTRVRFNQESNSVFVPAGMARVSSHALDSSLSPILKDFLDAELLRRHRINSFADQVRHVLLGSRISAPVTSTKMARYLGISPATLYRRLKAENVTFGRILADAQYELARAYLADSGLTVTQIAHIIGFTESASFTRAFSRWSDGRTPSQFRKDAVRDAAQHGD